MERFYQRLLRPLQTTLLLMPFVIFFMLQSALLFDHFCLVPYLFLLILEHLKATRPENLLRAPFT